MKHSVLILSLFAAWVSAAEIPQRIVSLSPNVTELLYGIGAFHHVVGVSDFCSYPPEAAKLPSVGAWDSPSLEKLAALKPDLVILDDAQATLLEENFKKLGFHMLIATDHAIGDVYRAIVSLGQATGRTQEAASLLKSTREGLARVSQKTAPLPKTKVVVIVDRTPGTVRDLYTATQGGYLSELVEIAGGHVALPQTKLGYAKLSKEDLFAINPDVILDFVHGAKNVFSGDPVEAWYEMPELIAVRKKRVYPVNLDYVPHASQRMVQTAELFMHLIHPEVK